MYVGRGIYVLTGGKLMYYIGAYKVDACGVCVRSSNVFNHGPVEISRVNPLLDWFPIRFLPLSVFGFRRDAFLVSSFPYTT